MRKLSEEVLITLKGKTLAAAESLTGGAIGAEVTSVPGASRVFKGGIVSYCNEIKHGLLSVPEQMLAQFGAVSSPVAVAMAKGARNALHADVAVSATGLAGPDGDDFGHPVGTVFIGYADAQKALAEEFHFAGDRDAVRHQAVQAALEMILRQI